MSTDENAYTACLAGYLNEAALDSSGVFTLSEDRSAEKLARFRLPDPRLYVLNAVAAAVACQAEWLKLYCDADDFILTARVGAELPEALRGLTSRILQERQPPGWRELALAYYGAQALKPGFIHLTAGSQLLKWRPSGLEEVAQETLPDGANLRLHVREQLGLRTAKKFLARITGQSRLDSEEDALKRHCNLVPVPAQINGQPLVRPLTLGQTHETLKLGCDQLAAHHPLQPLVTRRSLPGDWPAVLARRGRLPPYLVLVVQGVNFRLAPEALGHPDLRGIVYADHLRKDLSQTSLVKDEAFQSVVNIMRGQASNL